ncbi:hypothetical protein LJR027_000956 [Terrabacter sp. LjRoot27]|uniref:hypothetical protein n=1 Tax=Terrabacter sp. LjRoot27 TaxID=3342306 RepID=UPI003ECCFC05
MCTVLITYSTPPPPPDAATESHDTRVVPTGTPVTSAGPASSAYAATTAGIDEAIAASIADELSHAGHRVTCRPCVAITSREGFDLVVAVDHLHVSHWSGRPSVRGRPTEPPDGGSDAGPEDGRATIPMTWCADWRAVDAWARSVGDHLVHYLEVRTELAHVRAELDRCRAMLRAVTPEPRPVSAVELGRPVGHDSARARHPQRLASAGPTQRS